MDESKPYNGLLGLDRLPKWAKIIIWIIFFIATALISLPSIGAAAPTPSISGPLMYLIAPEIAANCFAGVGLRLAGIRWRYIFLFWFAIILLSCVLWLLIATVYAIIVA